MTSACQATKNVVDAISKTHGAGIDESIRVYGVIILQRAASAMLQTFIVVAETRLD